MRWVTVVPVAWWLNSIQTDGWILLLQYHFDPFDESLCYRLERATEIWEQICPGCLRLAVRWGRDQGPAF